MRKLLYLAPLLLWCLPAHAAIAATSRTCTNRTTGSASTIACTLSGALTAGNMLVLGVTASKNVTLSGCSGGGNTYTITAASPSLLSTTNSAWIVYARNIAAATPTVTCTFGSTDTITHAIFAREFSGLDAVWPFENDNATGTGTSTTINLPAMVAANASVMVYNIAISAGTISSVNSPWTQGSVQTDSADGYQIGAAATYTTAMTSSNSAWASMSAVFVASGHMDSSFWKGCYETPFGTQYTINAANLDMTSCDHIFHVGGTPQADGSIVKTANFDTKSTSLITLAHANGGKVLFTLGAEGGGSLSWTGAVSNIGTFVTNVMTVVNSDGGFDGVDVDWEGSGYTAAGALTLLNALRTALGTKLLTSFVLGQGPYWNDYGSTHNLQDYLDRLDMQTYDLGGLIWSVAWFNAPVFAKSTDTPHPVDYYVTTGFIGDGVIAAKSMLGLPFYGYSLTGGNAYANRPRVAFGGTPPTLAEQDYNLILSTYDTSQAIWDYEGQNPWIRIPSGWLTYDDPASTRAKVYYAKSKSLGGVYAYNLNTDYISTVPHHVLMNAVKQAAAQTAVGGSNIQ